ncbi:MAG: flagellar basal body-associated FliL family protein [Bdellovibrio sp.]|nr:flagellar basal body-associated FliL family protein [Bdellovibrio sp.]
MSLDSLDSVLAEEDPEFAKSLAEIGPDDPANTVVIEESELEYRLEDEIKHWKDQQGWRAKVATFLPFVPWISYKVNITRTNLRLSVAKFKEQARYNIRNAGPLLLGWLKGLLQKLRGAIGDGLSAFKDFPLTKKLATIGLVVAAGFSGYVIYRIANHKLIPASEELFLGSLEDWAEQKYFYEPNEVESFYDSTRTTQNVIVTQKIFVNLKRSTQSGGNPMGVFEFYVEGTDSDVLVEFKYREPEVKDLFNSTIADMTYDQVSTGEGKRLMCERLRKEVNRILTKGKVRRIFVKTAIVKP